MIRDLDVRLGAKERAMHDVAIFAARYAWGLPLKGRIDVAFLRELQEREKEFAEQYDMYDKGLRLFEDEYQWIFSPYYMVAKGDNLWNIIKQLSQVK